ncbi:MAG: YbaB/EbfC family nucleoid-associated protein [Candidatus Peribacter sp.]|jgi:DNA-binding protein YbaB|nr:YbaB/EbfC family nucleoid-associated protein [Candidatus Peribacter sp.]MBT4392596.1 YbaB/EbfC family nucleoid-associated protein [Candidatus Peribacter sp.]MBT4600434.1 YbaB/EbfC family nucleoid-associated protein [Candidatus Peribacter sp.]MBT5149074.1 YbaB/EbfC family nucleoid-associated protein [Candidatus Peribacter sp.]MBT5637550.1 YbaB/EbfC family nucleoid-associated protein [Candidatus Peribacter sp.]
MTSFKQAKDMFKLQKQAKQIKKELKNIHVEAEAEGVIVTVNAEQEIVSITIAEEVPRDRIPALLTDALNRALKKAQVVATEKMQVVMNQMGMGAPEQAMGGIGNS